MMIIAFIFEPYRPLCPPETGATRSKATEGVDNPLTAPPYTVLDKTKIQETFGLDIPYWTAPPQAVHRQPDSNGKVNDNEDDDDDGDEKRKTASKQNLRLSENRITTES